MNKLQKKVIDYVVCEVSEYSTRLLVDLGKTWRFYFDENEQNEIKNGLKFFLTGVIENAKK